MDRDHINYVASVLGGAEKGHGYGLWPPQNIFNTTRLVDGTLKIDSITLPSYLPAVAKAVKAATGQQFVLNLDLSGGVGQMVSSNGLTVDEAGSNLIGVSPMQPVTVIADRAFAGHTLLHTITLPNTLTSFGYNVFAGNSNLYNIFVQGGIPLLPNVVDGDIVGTREGFRWFTDRDGVLYSHDFSILHAFPQARIGNYSVAEAAANAPTTETVIAPYAFYQSRLTSIEMTNVTSVGRNAFTGSSLVVERASGLQVVEHFAVGVNGTSTIVLNEVTLQGVTRIADYAFAWVGRQSRVTGIHLPIGFLSIGQSAFAGNAYIRHADLSLSAITRIYDRAFFGTSALGVSNSQVAYARLVLPDTLQIIGNSAFANSGLSGELTIPVNVVAILSGAFEGASITTVNMLPTTPPPLAPLVWDAESVTRVYVPYLTRSRYESGLGWSGFRDVFASRLFNIQVVACGIHDLLPNKICEHTGEILALTFKAYYFSLVPQVFSLQAPEGFVLDRLIVQSTGEVFFVRGGAVPVFQEFRDIVLVPVFVPINFYITWYTNIPHNLPLQTHFNLTQERVELPHVYKTGHTLAGWFDNPTFIGQAISYVVINGHEQKSFYAKWTPITTAVRLYRDENGAFYRQVDIVFGENFTLTTISQNGHSFMGWHYREAGATHASRVTTGHGYSIQNWHIPHTTYSLFARWRSYTYNIVIDVNGEFSWVDGDGISDELRSVLASQSVPSSAKLTEMFRQSGQGFRDGYRFVGLLDSNGNFINWTIRPTILVDGTAFTITPFFEVEMHTLVFNLNGTIVPITLRMDATINLPTPNQRLGHTFLGWRITNSTSNIISAGDMFTFNRMPDLTRGNEGNARVYLEAVWIGNPYRISFNIAGVTVDLPTNHFIYVGFGTQVGRLGQQYVAHRRGHNFAGWYFGNQRIFNANGTPTLAVWNIAQNVTLQARFEVRNYTITFNANGGTALTQLTFNVNNVATMQSQFASRSTTRTMFQFNGWRLNNASGQVVTQLSQFIDGGSTQVTLFANWLGYRYVLQTGRVYNSAGTFIRTFSITSTLTLNSAVTILDLAGLSRAIAITVSTNVRELSLLGHGGTYTNFRLHINVRTIGLILRLDRVNIEAPVGQHGINSTASFNLDILLVGASSIQAGRGADGINVANYRHGRQGGSGINVPNSNVC
ncbi:MAG: leucine-rich repeat protein [Firmicutes bacterium]|nr:leucine-rich repeat protein [Bacillota bacterium]